VIGAPDATNFVTKLTFPSPHQPVTICNTMWW